MRTVTAVFPIRILLALILVMTLACCQNAQDNPFGMGQSETIGTVGGAGIGAALGGIFGKSPLYAAAGAAVGGLIGNRIGAFLDERDKERLAAATNDAAEHAHVGQRVHWSSSSPSGGSTASGWVTPRSAPYHNAQGQTCREMTQTASKNGQTESETGTLCRTYANGSPRWVTPQS